MNKHRRDCCNIFRFASKETTMINNKYKRINESNDRFEKFIDYASQNAGILSIQRNILEQFQNTETTFEDSDTKKLFIDKLHSITPKFSHDQLGEIMLSEFVPVGDFVNGSPGAIELMGIMEKGICEKNIPKNSDNILIIQRDHINQMIRYFYHLKTTNPEILSGYKALFQM